MPTQLPGPAYRIQTQRLLIRCWEPTDARLLKAAIDASLDHLRPWMPWAADEPQTEAEKVEWLRAMRGQFDLNEDFAYGIFDPAASQVLGGIGLHPRVGPQAREIGYWIQHAFINQGLATEATAAVIRVAFEIERIERVEIHCDPRNLASAAIPRKLGFQHQGTMRHPVRAVGTPPQVMVWSLTAAVYSVSPAAAAEVEAFDVLGRRLL
jgi:RimJ/RimL family protein N-acetyltransferase